MEEILNMISNNSVTLIIVALFLWDWINNKKTQSTTLVEISKTNNNVATSLELLRKLMEETENKLDDHDKRGVLILGALEDLKKQLSK